jgi:hypothetical protein
LPLESFDLAFDSGQYGLQIIKEAQRDGYIIRVKVDSKGKKKGAVVNSSTSGG